jgi:hypothetical protein
MPGEVPITLAVEDELSEYLLRALLIQTKRNFLVMAVYGKKGAGFLKQKLPAFNNAAKGNGFLLVTDLDNCVCVPHLIQNWFTCGLSEYPKRKHNNLVFRVAVREIESWVLADRERFADYFGLAPHLIPDQTDTLHDPKQFLLQIVARCRKRSLREDIVPKAGDKRKVGPDYNGRLGDFIQTRWRAETAILHSASLQRAWNLLGVFRPIFKTA